MSSSRRVFLTRFIPNTLAFQIKLEDSAQYLRVPLSVFYVRRFPEEAPKFPENFLSLSTPCKLLRFFLPPDPPIISAVSAIFAGLLFSFTLIWRVYLGCVHPKRFPVFSGLQNYWRDCSAPASDVLGSLLPDFLFSC